jgi:hypothetical protein
MSSLSVIWKKNYNNSKPSAGSSNAKSTPINIQKKRKSSFHSLYSPYTRRRSFLSKTMIENESLQCYKLSNYSSFGSNDENIPTYSISLSESQGFLWNQDLFATSYQQSEAGVDSMMSMSNDSYYLDDYDENYSRRHAIDVIDIVVNSDDYLNDDAIIKGVSTIGEDNNEYTDNNHEVISRENTKIENTSTTINNLSNTSISQNTQNK